MNLASDTMIATVSAPIKIALTTTIFMLSIISSLLVGKNIISQIISIVN